MSLSGAIPTPTLTFSCLNSISPSLFLSDVNASSISKLTSPKLTFSKFRVATVSLLDEKYVSASSNTYSSSSFLKVTPSETSVSATLITSSLNVRAVSPELASFWFTSFSSTTG